MRARPTQSLEATTDPRQAEPILALIDADPWMMAAIRAAARLDLPQWMIGGGFIRNKVWDHLHGIHRETVDTPDIDQIYFDPADVRKETEKSYDAQLRELCDVNWSTKNQARMHMKGGFPPFTSAEDGLAHWVESPSCIAVTVSNGQLQLVAPHGISDLVNLVLRPTPYYAHRPEVLLARSERKQWLAKWPKLRIVLDAHH